MTAEPAWDHAAPNIPDAGLARQRTATAEELWQIARALDLTECRSLEAKYTIVPLGTGRYRVSGTFEAIIAQACVVSLEPVTSAVDESFEATFWPQEDIPAPRSGELDIDDEPAVEPIVAGRIGVGRLVFECLAAAIDPFPRQPGASIDWPSAPPAESSAGKPESPFAVLANIKSKG